jgi:hypothetical protein
MDSWGDETSDLDFEASVMCSRTVSAEGDAIWYNRKAVGLRTLDGRMMWSIVASYTESRCCGTWRAVLAQRAGR